MLLLLMLLLLVAWVWGPTTNVNISTQNIKTPSHVRYCVYMSSGYPSYHTLTPAQADLYIGELENRPQKDMHITIRASTWLASTSHMNVEVHSIIKLNYDSV